MKKTDRTNKNRTAKGKILSLMQTLSIGESFLTECTQNEIQRYSVLYNIKVKSRTVYLLDIKTNEIKKAQKVTLI